jgi:hypothetical protein
MLHRRGSTRATFMGLVRVAKELRRREWSCHDRLKMVVQRSGRSTLLHACLGIKIDTGRSYERERERERDGEVRMLIRSLWHVHAQATAASGHVGVLGR